MKNWPFSPRRIRRELALIAALNLLCYLLFSHWQLFEHLDDWLHSHPAKQIGDVLLIGLTMTASMSLFAFRRLRESHALLKVLRRQAESDEATGLSNRRHANRTLQQETERSQRSERPFSVLLIDIDHFKTINDSYGHPIGDLVLRGFAKLLRQSARQLDTAVRWGGEEFLLICPETGQEGALQLANRLAERVRRHAFACERPVTISVGVAALRRDDTPESLIQRADACLYQAKQAGRDRCVGAAKAENEG
nr:GGDEF domain-containing protein [Chromobacterium sp. ASV5]